MKSSNVAAVWALIRNDIRLFRADRRAVVIGVIVPILIAAFFGYVFGGPGKAESGKIPLVIVDEDQSDISKAITSDIAKESMVSVEAVDRDIATARVKAGKAHVAAIIPKDFGIRTITALFNRQNKPHVVLMVDPSQTLSSRVVEGLFAQHGMEEITRVAFAGSAGPDALGAYVQRLEQNSAAHPEERPEVEDLKTLLTDLQRTTARRQARGQSGSGIGAGLTIPYEVDTANVTAGADIPYNGYAHSFAGMTTQFLLLAGIDAGVLLLMTRERGIWHRLRSAPIGKTQFLIARTTSTTLIGIFQVTVIYLVAMAIFGVRITGSVPGFVMLVLALCLLNAAFGLMLASSRAQCRCDTRHRDHGGATAGDARWGMGAVVRIPPLAAAGVFVRPHSLGGGRPRCHDLAGIAAPCRRRTVGRFDLDGGDLSRYCSVSLPVGRLRGGRGGSVGPCIYIQVQIAIRDFGIFK